MPHRHVDKYNSLLKRKCICGGEPEVLLDFVDDFIVRCKSCHRSTQVFIEPEDAIEHWENGDTPVSQLDLLTDDLDKNLAGEVLYMAIAKDDAYQFNQQSCDCQEVIIAMQDQIFVATHESNGELGAIGLDRINGFNGDRYSLRITPPADGSFSFVKVLYHDNGAVDCIKYHYGDRYLFIFSSEDNLIVTKSLPDLTEEDDTPIPQFEDSVLFE